ncbi:acyl-CoA dehydrogenase family protein [Actinomadura sp. 21ATH]|uniref:acyl-CoA dehydrogenase family protein n=1 Tax=Actinomadura sp. 21ATH TaxID=1735444 RepID=UPI0035C19D59
MPSAPRATAPSASPAPTGDDLVRRAAEMRPLLVERQAETERRTYYAEDVHEMFREGGFYRMLVPRRYGGLALPFSDYARVLVELAHGCAGTAWCFGLAAAHALQVGSYFGKHVQDEVFGDGEFRAASVAAPGVVARREDGGWRLDGTVGYCSGVPYSTHFVGQALIDGLPREEQARRMLLYIAPRSEWTMLDDWGGDLGLKGSGSHSIRFDGGRIPADYALEGVDMLNVAVDGGTPGYALHGDALYSGRSMAPFTMTLCAITVGAGYAALDAFEEEMRTRRTALPPIVPRLTDPDYHRWYGEGLAKIATAEAALMRCATEHHALCERTAAGGPPYGAEEEVRLGAIAREAMLQVIAVVEGPLRQSVGAGVLDDGARFTRILRDLAMVAAHRNTVMREPLYRVLAGLHLGLA